MAQRKMHCIFYPACRQVRALVAIIFTAKPGKISFVIAKNLIFYECLRLTAFRDMELAET